MGKQIAISFIDEVLSWKREELKKLKESKRELGYAEGYNQGRILEIDCLIQTLETIKKYLGEENE